jgi:hypothetical protein
LYWLAFTFTFHCIMYDIIMKWLISYWLGFTFTFHFNIIKQLVNYSLLYRSEYEFLWTLEINIHSWVSVASISKLDIICCKGYSRIQCIGVLEGREFTLTGVGWQRFHTDRCWKAEISHWQALEGRYFTLTGIGRQRFHTDRCWKASHWQAHHPYYFKKKMSCIMKCLTTPQFWSKLIICYNMQYIISRLSRGEPYKLMEAFSLWDLIW